MNDKPEALWKAGFGSTAKKPAVDRKNDRLYLSRERLTRSLR